MPLNPDGPLYNHEAIDNAEDEVNPDESENSSGESPVDQIKDRVKEMAKQKAKAEAKKMLEKQAIGAAKKAIAEWLAATVGPFVGIGCAILLLIIIIIAIVYSLFSYSSSETNSESEVATNTELLSEQSPLSVPTAAGTYSTDLPSNMKQKMEYGIAHAQKHQVNGSTRWYYDQAMQIGIVSAFPGHMSSIVKTDRGGGQGANPAVIYVLDQLYAKIATDPRCQEDGPHTCDFMITESWPTTTYHQSRCHRIGACIDIGLRAPNPSCGGTAQSACSSSTLARVDKFLAVASEVGLDCLNEYNRASGHATGGHLHCGLGSPSAIWNSEFANIFEVLSSDSDQPA